MAEELALEQGFGQRAAVDRDQGVEAAHAGGMNGADNQLFSGAALACDQDIGVGGADRSDGVEYLAHGGALSDEVARVRGFGNGFAQADVFFFRAPVGQGFLYEVRDFVRIERLADVVVGPVFQGSDCGFD